MALSLHFWKKTFLVFLISFNLFSKELYLKTDKEVESLKDYLILPESFENSCNIYIDIKNDLEEKILNNLWKVNYLKVLNFNFLEGENEKDWASYLLKVFSIYAKAENPEIKIFLTGNLEWLDEDIVWYFDGVENARIFSHLLKVQNGGLKEWIKEDAPFLISLSKNYNEASFFLNYLKDGFYPANFLKVFPQDIIPLIKDDLSFGLVIPQDFKGNIFLSGENFKSGRDIKGREINLKSEKDGVSFYIESKEFNLVFLKKPEGEFFSEKEEFEREKIFDLKEVLSRAQLLFLRANDVFPYYKAETRTDLNISFGSVTKPYYIKIKGKMHFNKGEEEIWEWDEVEIEGSKFKGEKFPPIPVLMPEKVKINPFFLYPQEDYNYEILNQGRESVILAFKPKDSFLKKEILAYSGKIYLNYDLFPLKIERSQVNLKGEFLALEEELYYRELEGVPVLINYKGKETLNILGGISNVEIETHFDEIEKIDKRFEKKGEGIYFERTDYGWVSSKKFPERFLTFGLIKMPEEDFPLPLGGISWISLESKNQYNFIFAGILGIFNKSFFFKKSSINLDSFALLYPFPDYPYREGEKIEREGVEIRPLSLNLTYTSPISRNFNFQIRSGFSYLHFEGAKEKDQFYFVPPSSFTFSQGFSLNFSKKGFKFSLQGESFSRSEDFRFGFNREDGKTNGKKWGFLFGKDFKIFKSFMHFDFGYYGGKDLDRFSSFRSGSFGNLEMEGFPSGSITSNKIFITHLNYNFPFIFSKSLNFGFDYLRDLEEKKEYFSLKFSTFFNFPFNFLMQIQGGLGLKGDGKGASIRALFFKAI